MSAPIKPPTTPAPGLAHLEGAGDVQAKSSVEGVGTASVGTHSVAPPSPQVGSVSEGWLNKLQAGEVTRQQAIEGLVHQALDSHGLSQLSGAQRSALEQVLRATLLDDPVLSRLLGDP